MDFVFLISICSCTEFLSIHGLKLDLFLIQTDSFNCKILKITLKSFPYFVFRVLYVRFRIQTQISIFYRLFLSSCIAMMFPVTELLRCHWDGFVTTVAQSTVGFNTLHSSTCKISRYYSPGFIKALLINSLNYFNTLHITECKMSR